MDWIHYLLVAPIHCVPSVYSLTTMLYHARCLGARVSDAGDSARLAFICRALFLPTISTIMAFYRARFNGLPR